jgi:predicted nucleic acid-binding protein
VISLSLNMLDTNTVSHLMRQHARSCCRMLRVPMETLCISAVTDAELRFGLAKRPLAEQLHRAVHEFLLRVDSLPWHRHRRNAQRTSEKQLRRCHETHKVIGHAP